MSTNRPATLHGSLLARKGDAAPAIASNSPLLEELGEPRPGAGVGSDRSAANKPAAVAQVFLGPVSSGLNWLAGHPAFGVFGLAVGIAVLFAVTITALTPSSDTASSHKLSKPESTVVSRERISLPAVSDAITKPPEEAKAAAMEPTETATALPDPPVVVAEPEPKKSAVPPPQAVTDVPPVPPVKSVAVAPPAKRPAAPAPSVQSGRYLLQLSAVTTAKSARLELARLERKLRGILGKRKIIVVKAVPPGKPPVYRLRASSYESRAAARTACTRIRKIKMACWVVTR